MPEITSSWVWASRRIEKVGIFVGDLGQAGGDLGLVVAGLGLDGPRDHRHGELDRPGPQLGDRGVATHVADRVGDMEVVELGDGHDVAGDRHGDFFLLLALKDVDVPRLGRLAAAQVDERRVGGQLTGQDPQVAELTHELVVDGLEDLGDERAVLGGEDLLLRAVGLGRPRAEAMDVGRAQAAVGDQIEQLAQAKVLAGADAEHGHELPLSDRVVGGPAQLVGLDRLTLQVAHHQVLVELDDLLDDHAIRLGGSQRAAGRVLVVRLDHVDDAGEAGALADRHVERHALGAEGLADRRQVGAVIDVVGIHLGDHDEPTEPEPAGFLENAPRVDLDSRRSRDGDHHVLDGRQSAQGVADEIGIARACRSGGSACLPRPGVPGGNRW